jgi:hypothetical protein
MLTDGEPVAVMEQLSGFNYLLGRPHIQQSNLRIHTYM